MVRKGTGPKRLDEPTLTESDWVEGALQLISEAGLRALTVEALAGRLGVTYVAWQSELDPGMGISSAPRAS